MNVKLISYSQSVDFVHYGPTNQQEEDITAQEEETQGEVG